MVGHPELGILHGMLVGAESKPLKSTHVKGITSSEISPDEEQDEHDNRAYPPLPGSANAQKEYGHIR